jgi:hypothetical protein
VFGFPPGAFLSRTVEFVMMNRTERDGELIGDFEPDAAHLGEGQVVDMGGLPAADQARVGHHEEQVGFVTQAAFGPDGEQAFIDTICDSRRPQTTRVRSADLGSV